MFGLFIASLHQAFVAQWLAVIIGSLSPYIALQVNYCYSEWSTARYTVIVHNINTFLVFSNAWGIIIHL